MHRIVKVGLALLVAACGAAAQTPRGEQVPLLTGTLGCYAGGEGGPTDELTLDPQYGTSFSGSPVMWPAGYTGWRIGAVVEVRDAAGNLKATTGRAYHISHAFLFSEMLGSEDDGSLAGLRPADVFPAAVECSYHHDFIDCTADATDMWCLPRETFLNGPTPTPPQPPP